MNKTTQRVFIWLIAIVMLVGTLGAYFVVILSNNNNAAQQNDIAKLQQELQEQQAACQAATIEGAAMYTKPEPIKFDKASVTELKLEDAKLGEGAEVTSNDQCVTVHYLGNTADGTVFDNSYDRSEPTAFTVGQVITGWQEGLKGMKEGGIRKMFIPSSKAYGEQGAGGSIGPNEPLYFYVELIKVQQ